MSGRQNGKINIPKSTSQCIENNYKRNNQRQSKATVFIKNTIKKPARHQCRKLTIVKRPSKLYFRIVRNAAQNAVQPYQNQAHALPPMNNIQAIVPADQQRDEQHQDQQPDVQHPAAPQNNEQPVIPAIDDQADEQVDNDQVMMPANLHQDDHMLLIDQAINDQNALNQLLQNFVVVHIGLQPRLVNQEENILQFEIANLGQQLDDEAFPNNHEEDIFNLFDDDFAAMNQWHQLAPLHHFAINGSMHMVNRGANALQQTPKFR